MKDQLVRLRKEELARRLGIDIKQMQQEKEHHHFTQDDCEVLLRALVGLQREIHDWLKPKRTLRIFREKQNPHAPKGTARLDQIEHLMLRIEGMRASLAMEAPAV